MGLINKRASWSSFCLWSAWCSVGASPAFRLAAHLWLVDSYSLKQSGIDWLIDSLWSVTISTSSLTGLLGWGHLTVICSPVFCRLSVSQARRARDGGDEQANGGQVVLKEGEKMLDSSESWGTRRTDPSCWMSCRSDEETVCVWEQTVNEWV